MKNKYIVLSIILAIAYVTFIFLYEPKVEYAIRYNPDSTYYIIKTSTFNTILIDGIPTLDRAKEELKFIKLEGVNDDSNR